MDIEEKRSLQQRVAALEVTLAEYAAVIDGLQSTLADVLAAHAVQNRDIRLARIVAQSRDSDDAKESKGGTAHKPKSYFRTRSRFFTDLLSDVYNSPVFYTFWFRRAFWWQEEKERAKLEQIRQTIQDLTWRK